MNYQKVSILISLFSALLSFPASYSFAQSNGNISGLVIDKQTQKPLASVSILVSGTNKNTISDTTGAFRITGLVPKAYNFDFIIIGYKPPNPVQCHHQCR